mmetsp:Transcript_6597/g.10795  ORF Transcript_6597/g.10795 Transcript_6597/m.10795 type:complete len:151 (+) Transcript_6597:72-524(+)
MKYFAAIVVAVASFAKANGSECYDYTKESQCTSSFEGDEKCLWCESAAVSASCVKESDAATLPSSVFQCHGLKTKAAGCETYTDHDSCMSATQEGETCAWCKSAAVSASCAVKSQAETLPSSVFQCEYQAWYMDYMAQAVDLVKNKALNF